MKCELCQEQEATIHLTQVVDGAVKKVHLCEACASQSGFDVHGPMSITDILLGLGHQDPTATAKPAAIKARDRSCPRCHLRRADFKKSGRLGCPDCYAAFADELEPLLRAMHRGDQHRGKVPAREQERVRTTRAVDSLQAQLEEAVRAERYEEAAQLRDAIQAARGADQEDTDAT